VFIYFCPQQTRHDGAQENIYRHDSVILDFETLFSDFQELSNGRGLIGRESRQFFDFLGRRVPGYRDLARLLGESCTRKIEGLSREKNCSEIEKQF